MTWYEWLMLLGVPSIISGIFFVLFNEFANKNRNKKDADVILRKGVQALLRNKLMECYKAYKERGWIDIAEKDNFNNMYQSYHALGKNGVMDSIWEYVMGLPTDPKE